MDTAKDQLLEYLENTKKALKHVSVSELNEAVSSVLKDKIDKKKEIDIVLETVSAEYGISKRTLIQSNSRGNIQVAKKMAYCLLHFTLNLNTRYIAARIFQKWQNSISIAIVYYKRLDLSIKTDKEFNETYNRLEQLILEKVKTQ